MWMDMIGATGQGSRAGNAEQAKQQIKAHKGTRKQGTTGRNKASWGTTT